MSNYSRVIVCWSGIDRAVDTKSEIDRRVALMLASGCMDRPRHAATAYPCGLDDVEPGTIDEMACETTIVLSANHFDPDELLSVLSAMEWEKPDEVEILWKDEEDRTYCKARLAKEQLGRRPGGGW